MQFLTAIKLEDAYNPWEKPLKMLQRNSESQEKLKIKWLYKVIKKPTRPKKLDYSNVI